MNTITKESRVHALLVEASQCLAGDRTARAKKLCEEAILLAPQSADVHMVFADVLAARSENDAARKHYEQATNRERYHFGAWLNFGVFLKETGDFKNAVNAFRNAVMIDSKSSLARYNLARALMDAEDYREASNVFLDFTKMEPNFAEGYFSLGVTQELAGEYDLAVSSFETALKHNPKMAGAYFRIGGTYQVLGKFDEAEPYYQKAIELNPRFGKSYAALATSGKLTGEEESEEALQRIKYELDRTDIDPSTRVHFHNAAFKILDTKGSYDEAFEHLRIANGMRDAAIEDKLEKDISLQDRQKAQFTPEFFSRWPLDGNPTDQPVFIVGMPRSGTTLTEQIIASHPRAAGAGELIALGSALIKFSRELDGTRVYPGFLIDISQEQLLCLCEYYLSGYPDKVKEFDRVTDKLPGNYNHLGTLTLMFPNAKFVYCKRNAIDNCLSCFTQNFSQDIWYSFSQEKVAAQYRLHKDIMDHWREVLPKKIHEVRYEDLTRDPEPNIRKLLEFCELEWDDACLNFHETERAVKTASIWQVRQPMYQTSVEKWKRYEKHLGPLIEGLGDLAYS